MPRVYHKVREGLRVRLLQRRGLRPSEPHRLVLHLPAPLLPGLAETYVPRRLDELPVLAGVDLDDAARLGRGDGDGGAVAWA